MNRFENELEQVAVRLMTYLYLLLQLKETCVFHLVENYKETILQECAGMIQQNETASM
jgi:hypothetical protein